MSFDLKCNNCGAPSASSIGVCPFCKSVMLSGNKSNPSKQDLLLTQLRKHYRQGKLSLVLAGLKQLFSTKPKYKENVSFLDLYLRVLFETDAPGSNIRSVISLILLQDANNQAALDFLDLQDAKSHLTAQKNDHGEKMIRSVIARSPKNPFAHFLLGSHIFWTEKDYTKSIIHLEKCTKLHPNFLRAWGCLGALYREIGNSSLAADAFRKAASLETDKKMKQFFIKNIKAL